jgi:GAF domain-containing protein/HAMP domain-containing protein
MTQESGNPKKEQTNRLLERKISLRARITLATTITAILASITIGYFATVRNDATQSFLGNQFQNTVRKNAESQIQALVNQEALGINKFFDGINQTVTSTSAYTANLLNLGSTFEAGVYWNANDNLYRLPSGAWDNSNRDFAAIFAPTNVSISERQNTDLNSVIQLDFVVPDILQTNTDIVALYFINVDDITVYYPNIDLANLVPPDFKATEQPFYTIATPENNPGKGSVWTPPYQDPALTGLIVTNSSPVYDNDGKFLGVIGADIQLAKITERVLSVQIGDTGYAFLMDSDGHIIAMPDPGYSDFDIAPEAIPVNETPKLTLTQQGPQNLSPIFQSMAQNLSGLSRVQIHSTEYYFAYTPIPSTGYSLGVVVPVSEMDVAFREVQAMVAGENRATQSFGFVLLGIVIAATTLVSLGLSQFLTNPLQQLTSTVQQISSGDLTARAPQSSVTEVNLLAEAFNSMTTRLKELLTGLEERVTERTTELETANRQIQHRASQFEAIAQVARSISTSQDLETLLPKITNVISEHFGFYHVGIFLLDDEKEFAVLRAANSPGGKNMLKRTHQLKVGETGIVGYVTSQGRPRIALDTGSDAIYFDNPDLPDTRSEMALPLTFGYDVIGALDVQSLEPNAFSPDDVSTLSTLADQVSIAIQNARLYEETRHALAQSQALYQQFTQSGWKHFKESKRLAGIRRSKATTTILREPLDHNEFNGDNNLNMPIKLRGQKIGSLKVRANDNHEWTQDEVDIATAIIERAAIAMENARLLDDAQRLANREQIIGEISATVSSSNDMEEILRSAVLELGRKMGGAEVVLELGTDKEKNVEPGGSIQQLGA